MENYKITDSELNSGVVAAPDTLVDTPQNNKMVFDRLPKLIATKFNGFVDSVIAKFSGYYTKEEVDGKVDIKANADNVYSKEETFTKAETSQLIADSMAEAGAGDMVKRIYDTDEDGVVNKAEEAVTAENADLLRGFWLDYKDAFNQAKELIQKKGF